MYIRDTPLFFEDGGVGEGEEMGNYLGHEIFFTQIFFLVNQLLCFFPLAPCLASMIFFPAIVAMQECFLEIA